MLRSVVHTLHAACRLIFPCHDRASLTGALHATTSCLWHLDATHRNQYYDVARFAAVFPEISRYLLAGTRSGPGWMGGSLGGLIHRNT